MVEVRDSIYYTKTHEWVKKEDKTARIGLSDHAQHELTDVAYVELPGIGEKIEKGSKLGVIESVKSSSEIYSPVSGVVKEVNTELEDSPEFVNESPYDDGWLVALEGINEADFEDLMNAEEYRKYLETL